MEYNLLNNEEQQWSLLLSKQTLHEYVLHKKILEVPMNEIPPRLIVEQSCFVTYKKNNSLRGCIGSITPSRPLYQEIIMQSIHAAVKDPRFSPVTDKELPKISIELTILSVPANIATICEFIPGEHGIIFTKNKHSAVFLPQVAIEQKWGREETLDHLAVKAGLHKNDWKTPEATFQIFTAQKIVE